MADKKFLTLNELYEYIGESYSDLDFSDWGSRKKPNEKVRAAAYDIGLKMKELPFAEKSWSSLIDRLGLPISAEAYRTFIRDYGRKYDNHPLREGDQRMLNGFKVKDAETVAELDHEVNKIKEEHYVQQVKTQDAYNQYRATIRNQARIEEMKDLIEESVAKIPELPPVEYEGRASDGGKEAILMFSDLHIGVKIDGFCNKYDLEIARRRVAKLVSDTISYCKANNVYRLNVVQMGDAIEGTIHTSSRLVQEMDVVSQVIDASEIMADAMSKLQAAAPEVVYRSCLDNHSRALPDLNEGIEEENWGRIIDFYLKARLAKTGIVFADDNLDPNIGRFQLDNGKRVMFVHGHLDSLDRIFQNMIGATREFPDYVLLGHYHEPRLKSYQNCVMIVNGSICGTDQYALSKRLFSDPSQTLLVFDGDNLITHIIGLKGE